MRLSNDELALLKKAGYSTRIIDLYREMTNFGFIENPDAALDYKGPCGDIIKLYLTINEKNVIGDAKFQYIGCPALAASGSILTKMVKDKSLQEAKKITEEAVLTELGGLPDAECHCAKLATTALRKTIAKYETIETLQ
jgi:NifU-like protein involved in Fe-S cluster formation